MFRVRVGDVLLRNCDGFSGLGLLAVPGFVLEGFQVGQRRARQLCLAARPRSPVFVLARPLVALTALALGVSACGPGTSARVAHRGGGAWWPENSLLAIQGALDRGWTDLSFDVFLTQDRVPVLHHAPYLDEERCRTLGDRPIEARVWLLETSADELVAGYRCGGVRDSSFPSADLAAAPVPLLDELIAELEEVDSPPTIHLVAGFQPNVSHDPAIFAAEVLGRWGLAEWAGEAPGLVVVAELGETLTAFRRTASQQDFDLQTTLSWPRLPPAGGAGLAGVGVALGVSNGVIDPVSDWKAAGADGIRLHPAISTRTDARRMAEVASHVEVGPVHSRADVKALSKWPVDAVLTSDPELP